MDILIPYLHYIGIMILMGSLITEHVTLKPGITKSQIKSLATTDLIYGIAAAVVLVTGLLRWFVVDVKGAEFFNKNPLFHIKVTLFVVIVILSIFPTLKFLKWRKSIRNGQEVEVSEAEAKKQLMFIRIELLLLAIIPLLAVMVAMGIRM
ncbi:MAG: DUF2214 family protein [bacterium]|jgi:putative membrane protein